MIEVTKDVMYLSFTSDTIVSWTHFDLSNRLSQNYRFSDPLYHSSPFSFLKDVVNLGGLNALSLLRLSCRCLMIRLRIPSIMTWIEVVVIRLRWLDFRLFSLPFVFCFIKRTAPISWIFRGGATLHDLFHWVHFLDLKLCDLCTHLLAMNDEIYVLRPYCHRDV